MNIQYAIADDCVYILEANPRASRTVPLVSKVCNIPMARYAAQIMMGETLADLDLKPRKVRHFGVKESVFPFNMFPEVDPVLGPEMRSTGEVLGIADSFGYAFFKAQEATQAPLPTGGAVLITVADKDKQAILEAARLFSDLGFTVLATQGTGEFLSRQGIAAQAVTKLGHGRPDIVDLIKNGDIQLLVNTPGGKASKEDDSYIRKAAVKYKVPYMTTVAASLAAARGIAARNRGEEQIHSLQEYHANIT
jgi:carbamoyl-phosphate synthase large subunit